MLCNILRTVCVLVAIFHVDLCYPVPECPNFWILLELRMMQVVVTTGAVSDARNSSRPLKETL